VNRQACCIVQISGRVQQVGFRMWAFSEARRLDIRGWVRNMPDGRVEACLAAAPEQLDQMVECLRQGPPLARVDAIERADIEPPDNLDGFRVLG
jgi:acylphosphatase